MVDFVHLIIGPGIIEGLLDHDAFFQLIVAIQAVQVRSKELFSD